jgi:hypothetical protein
VCGFPCFLLMRAGPRLLTRPRGVGGLHRKGRISRGHPPAPDVRPGAEDEGGLLVPTPYEIPRRLASLTGPLLHCRCPGCRSSPRARSLVL